MKILQVSYTSRSAPTDFLESLKTTGFAVLKDHPIGHDLISRTYQEWEAFFQSSQKYDYQFNEQTQSGYFPIGTEKAKGYDVYDLKEFYHYYLRFGLPPTVSQETPNLRNQLNALATTLLGWLDQKMPQELKSKLSMPLNEMITNSEQTLFRVIHYPPIPGDVPPRAVRAAAHEDINLLTLLPAATEAGLEVKDLQGNWHGVSCDPGTIAINAGDMLAEATTGYFPSTTHRVVNPALAKNVSRYSMPLFLHARPDVRLSSRHTAGSYLRERLIEIGLIKT